MYKFISLFIAGSILWIHGVASDPYPKNTAIDIKHYRFTIELNDSTNVMQGLAEITILFKKSKTSLGLDLVDLSSPNSGMAVIAVNNKENPLRFTHLQNRLIIYFPPTTVGDVLTFKINYSGIPMDGLIIGKNKFGERTFFADNWPNRARYWLPTIDHPYDKASCEFIVIAPNHYQAVANGILIERSSLPHNRQLSHWKESVDIPTKVMVIGVARFATTVSDVIDGIRVETWVYPQNKKAGFTDFKIASSILSYFIKKIGPYPYMKLANVQSSTRFGGMENASCIFYFENSVTGNNERESLIAHEIAHQWFGDSASELDWHHVWLSEGFATYFTNLYYEDTYGRDQFTDRLKSQRVEVINYFAENPAPVIDTIQMDITKVLNTNSYQKGSWILHMLRREVGDEAFWSGIRTYYDTYKHGNAMTNDLRQIMEKESGKDLEAFFQQWLRIAGHPKLSGSWSYNDRSKTVKLVIKQIQNTPFDTPLDIGLKHTGGNLQYQTIRLNGARTEISISTEIKPTGVVLDPNTWLLFEGALVAK